MAEKTGIAWTRSTFNPWIGCTKVGPGCDHCYAEALDARHRWGLKKGDGPAKGVAPHWGLGAPRHHTGDDLWSAVKGWNDHAAWEKEHGRLRQPNDHWHTPGFWPVFCASLADIFDNEVPEAWRNDLFNLILRTPHLTWLLLTKRIGNVAKMMPSVICSSGREPLIPNVWLGASVVNQEEANRDLPKLMETPAAKRFVSYEPALGPVDFSPWMCSPHEWVEVPSSNPETRRFTAGLSWVIIGGESAQGGAKARPFNIAWARQTVSQCKAAGVPCFVKQLGWLPCWTQPGLGDVRFITKDRSGSDPAEWPEDLRVQEFPERETP